MLNGPMLGTDQARHTGAQRDFHVDSALRIERTYPTDASLMTEPTTLVFTRELVCGEMRSLTNRA